MRSEMRFLIVGKQNVLRPQEKVGGKSSALVVAKETEQQA